MVDSTVNHLLDDPRSYKESVGRTDHETWREAMYDEIKAIDKKGVWFLAFLPAGRK